jgi:hypothetical protein
MSLSIKTTRSGKVTTPMMPIGWNNGLGLRDQIKREVKGVHTSRKDSVMSTNDHTLEAQKRFEMMGDGYGSHLRGKSQTRGVDFMRKVDYSGNTGSTSGIGEPLGKVPEVGTKPPQLSIIRDAIRGAESEGLNRQSVFNVKEGISNVKKASYATTTQSRGITKADTSAVRGQDQTLTIETVPTKTYTASSGKKTIRESSSFKFNTNMIQENLKFASKSGTNTLSKFNPRRVDAGKTGQITDRLNISLNSGKKQLPKFETVHDTKELVSKLKAFNVGTTKSDGRVYKRNVTETDVIMKPTRKLADAKIIPVIKRDTSERKDNYTIRNQPLRLNNFQMKSGTFIPTF